MQDLTQLGRNTDDQVKNQTVRSKPRGAEHPIVPTDMHIASLVKCLFKSLAHVLTGLSVFILLTWKVVYMFWMQMQHMGSASYLLLVMTPALENNSSTVFSLVNRLWTTLQYQMIKRGTDSGQLCGR